MRLRLISLGVNWWSTHSQDVEDPFCFRRRAAWFNSTGLLYGRRLRLCWALPGQIRFNSNSGFNPQYPFRALGQIFESPGPKKMNGKTHLLLTRTKEGQSNPERFLVTLKSETHGQVAFTSSSWKSSTAMPISVSLRAPRYEAMILLGAEDWIRTDIGVWMITGDGLRLALTADGSRALQ